MPSSATSALKPAADAGNEHAIQALAATAADAKHQALWFLAAQPQRCNDSGTNIGPAIKSFSAASSLDTSIV
jgi:hypothetical protein